MEFVMILLVQRYCQRKLPYGDLWLYQSGDG
jgi:hypothetical protein